MISLGHHSGIPGQNPEHARTKHIDIRYHYVREALQEGVISLSYCPTDKMIADLLTKGLPRGRFEVLRKAMGMDDTKHNLHIKWGCYNISNLAG